MEKQSEKALRVSDAGSLDTTERLMTVGALERLLLEVWPKSDACAWDRTGLLVGDPASVLDKVAVSLDATMPALYAAQRAGANVLLTHHPVFLDAPDLFVPVTYQHHRPGALVRAAIELNISILSFHTALDVSPEALDALPRLLRLQPESVLEPLEYNKYKGFGRVCSPTVDDLPLSLRHLSARCVSVFGSLPRVWGPPERALKRIVCCGGSAGSLIDACLDTSVDCLLCGEVKYHEALGASLSGLAIIELGHDISELPLCTLLAARLQKLGIAKSCITMIDQSNNWYTPETTRC